jgi:hypothetical protein
MCADVAGYSPLATNLLGTYQHAARNHEVDHQNGLRLRRSMFQVLLSGVVKLLPTSRVSIDG